MSTEPSGVEGEPASAGPVFDAAASATRFATGFVLVALVSLVCGEAMLRGMFNYSLGFAEEVTGYGVVFLTFLGAALALRRGALFRVHFLFDKLPANTRMWITRIFVIVAVVICTILAWKAFDLMLSSMSRGKFAPTVLRTPLWLPQLLPPLGFVVIGLFLVEQFLLTLHRPGERP